MYAVIETGGKQYRVEVGTELEVELLDVAPGDAITLDRVLLVADGDTAAIGRPLVKNASVAAQVIRQARGEKLINFKYGPKTRRRVKKGHRQELTVLRISDIVLDGRSAAADVARAAEARLTERQRLEEAARRQAEADAALAAKLMAAAPDDATKAEAAAKPRASKPRATATKPSTATDAADVARRADAAPKPRPAKPSATESDGPAGKPKRARAAKKDE